MAFHRKIWEVTPLSAAIVPLAELKEQCRVDHDDEDATIASFGMAAADTVEKLTQRLLSPRQVVLRMDGLPTGRAPVRLYGGQVQSVTSVVIDGNEVAGCLAYGSSPAQLVPPSDWPIVAGDGLPVVITYVAGFADVPASLTVAMKIITQDLFDRSKSDGGGGEYFVPKNAMALIDMHRVLPW